MAQPTLIRAMKRQPAFGRMLDELPERGSTLRLAGLPGSSASLLAAALADAAAGRILLAVAAEAAGADALHADLDALCGDGVAYLYPHRESLPYEAEDPHVELGGLRVEALEAVLSGSASILVAPRRALQELMPIPDRLADLRVTLETGQALAPYELADRLDGLGFERVPMVEGVAQYAVRGGILDLFGFGSPDPLRVEFGADEIVSIRRFDILDQRSTGTVDRADVLPPELAPDTDADAYAARETRSLLDVLPRETMLFELDGESARDRYESTWSDVTRMYRAALERGRAAAPPDALFLPPDVAARRRAALARLELADDPGRAALRFDIREPEPIDRDIDRLNTILRAGAARKEETMILCDNEGQADRLEELLGNGAGMPPGTTLALGSVGAGFVLEGSDPPLRVLTDHEIFRRGRRLRRGRRFRGAVALESVAQLTPDDYVVHIDHGVGRFRGLERVEVGGEDVESMTIEYAGGEILRVPVHRLDRVERWMPDGEAEEPGRRTPRLHKIGGKSWSKLKKKTEKAIREMAAELIQLYAARQVHEGHATPPDTRWQKEMESSFLYEDTPDQREATIDVKRDLESSRPMDRLLCGDVGYGKTEVAVRAAFKMVQSGKQVAVLAPTTILVEQHLRTFRERLADYPVRVEALSRLRTKSEQQRILADLASGAVDIVIGTHRLLGDDVVFRDLGLLVVDEEQRFGVRHKARLKEIKGNIDVLALTATPIPRTLHLSLAGLRDLSLIRTPPRDRMPVITHVLPWIDEIFEDAIRRELDRGGQVFFVHNRIETIEAAAERVRSLVPDARVDIGHGRLTGRQLDRVMDRFLAGETQVLVTTAIIENGLDVPNANTLIVHRADRFGLAQLYQLRGRVGRSHHRAYCYLHVPEHANLDAERRLRVLEHHTELGSGYAVALKDLELRGAGNLLGREQSGFVHAVGLDTYMRLLEKTVRRMRADDGGEHREPPEVSLRGAAYIPDEYVAEPSQKLHLYRRLSRLEKREEVETLGGELRDRFGPPPREVERLLAGAALRLLGAPLGIARILAGDDDARINFRDDAVPRLTKLENAFRDRQIDVEVRRTMPLSLILRRVGAEPLTRTLVEVLEMLAE